jgi:putative ABC transport system substrate-binding protein
MDCRRVLLTSLADAFAVPVTAQAQQATKIDRATHRESTTPMCDFALKNRLPTLGPTRCWPEAGCLISYSANPRNRFRQAAIYVDKILKGARPADLPIEQVIE